MKYCREFRDTFKVDARKSPVNAPPLNKEFKHPQILVAIEGINSRISCMPKSTYIW